jgi:DNA primase
MDQVEEIKQKTDIVQLIGEHVQLKKAGVNWKGNCPFHNEKTPSFMVNPEKNIFHCFGCNEGGDVFTFIQKIEGLDFPEALKLLGEKAGVKIQNFDPRVSSEKNRLMELSSATTLHWQENMSKDIGSKSRDYLSKRGINEETIQDFKFGFALDSWDDLFNILKKRGFTESEIFLAGLTVKKSAGNNYYDRFRDRLIFPIQDVHGNVIGFTGRTFKKDENAKYINSPENPIYYKGKVLYGLDKAKRAIRETGYVIVVEGNMDVVACHQAGFKNVVACSGTALTLDQIKILKRYTENVALCFDQDEAGQRAAQRSMDLLFAEDVNIKIIQLLFGKDPDECIRKDVRFWEDSLKKSKSAMQFFIDKHLTEENLENINNKKTATKFLLELLVKIQNKIEQDHWLKKIAIRLDISESILRDALPQGNKTPAKVEKIYEAPKKAEQPLEVRYLVRILTILVNYPTLIGYAIDHLPADMIESESLANFYKSLIIYYNKDDKLTRGDVCDWLDENKDLEKSYKDSLSLYVDQVYEGFDEKALQTELIDLVRILKKNYYSSQLSSLNKELILAESDKDNDRLDELIKKIQISSENLDKLK